MFNPTSTLSVVDVANLKSFLQHPLRPAGTMKFHELQGFLFTVTCSPEPIAPGEWIPMVTNEEDALYTDEQQAQQILSLLMQLYNDTNENVLNRSDKLPSHCEFESNALDNFGEQSAIGQWSGGFLFGHEWLNDIWLELLPDEFGEDLGFCMMILSCFASRQLGEAFFDERDPDAKELSDRTFEMFAEDIRKLFPAALAAYANLGRSIFESLHDFPVQPDHEH